MCALWVRITTWRAYVVFPENTLSQQLSHLLALGGIPIAKLCSCSLKPCRILSPGAKLFCLGSEQYLGPHSKCYARTTLTVTTSKFLNQLFWALENIQPFPSLQNISVKPRIISSACLKLPSKSVPTEITSRWLSIDALELQVWKAEQLPRN